MFWLIQGCLLHTWLSGMLPWSQPLVTHLTSESGTSAVIASTNYSHLVWRARAASGFPTMPNTFIFPKLIIALALSFGIQRQVSDIPAKKFSRETLGQILQNRRREIWSLESMSRTFWQKSCSRESWHSQSDLPESRLIRISNVCVSPFPQLAMSSFKSMGYGAHPPTRLSQRGRDKCR